MNGYISSRGLINANDQAYINVGSDQFLAGAVSVKGEDTPEFMKRDEVLKRVRARMQTWHEIRVEGQDAVRRCVYVVLAPWSVPLCPPLFISLGSPVLN